MGKSDNDKNQPAVKAISKSASSRAAAKKHKRKPDPYVELQDAVVVSDANVRFVHLQNLTAPSSTKVLHANSWIKVHTKKTGALSYPDRVLIVHDPLDHMNNGQLAEVANTLQITWDKKMKSPQGKRLEKITRKKRRIHGIVEIAIEFDLP